MNFKCKDILKIGYFRKGKDLILIEEVWAHNEKYRIKHPLSKKYELLEESTLKDDLIELYTGIFSDE